jgi:hypothetical protein
MMERNKTARGGKNDEAFFAWSPHFIFKNQKPMTTL